MTTWRTAEELACVLDLVCDDRLQAACVLSATAGWGEVRCSGCDGCRRRDRQRLRRRGRRGAALPPSTSPSSAPGDRQRHRLAGDRQALGHPGPSPWWGLLLSCIRVRRAGVAYVEALNNLFRADPATEVCADSAPLADRQRGVLSTRARSRRAPPVASIGHLSTSIRDEVKQTLQDRPGCCQLRGGGGPLTSRWWPMLVRGQEQAPIR